MQQSKKNRKKNQKLFYNQWCYLSIFFIVLLLTGSTTIESASHKDWLFTLNSKYSAYKNPYFYQKESVELSAMAKYYDFETAVSKQINIKMYQVKKYKKGELYRLAVPSIGELGTERTNIYFYVTQNQIYRVFSYIYKNGKCITFYNNDKLLTSILDTDKKLIKNSEVVCQSEPILDKLEQGETGMHISITKQKNKIVYNRYNIQNNGERGFYESFVWKKGKGLVEYRSGYKAEADILYLDIL